MNCNFSALLWFNVAIQLENSIRIFFFFAFLAQCLGSMCTAIVYTQDLNLIFAICWLVTFIAKDIATDVPALNVTSRKKKENRIELTKRFCEIAQMYSDVRGPKEVQ